MTGHLVKAVDVLRDHRAKRAALLQLDERMMARIW